MDLERELRALDVEWPRTPELRLVLEPRPERRSVSRPLLVAVALALVALAAALAVPQSRAAILRFLHVGGETVQFVGTLPAAEERPLGAGLGPVVSLAEARRIVPTLLLPPGTRPTLHETSGVVSTVFRVDGRPVLLSAVRQDAAFLKKLAAGETNVEWVEVLPNEPGLWISGAPHVYLFPREPARLAGSTLVWAENGTTYRLEAPTLSRDEAITLARSLRYPGKG